MSALNVSRSGTLSVFFFLCFLIIGLTFPGFSYSQASPIPEGAGCAECGMMVDVNSKFSTEVVTDDGKKLFFCDIGDMLRHFRSDRGKARTVYVKDYINGQWLNGKKAFYVSSKRFSSPMSWGIAAFSERSEARKWGNPVDFNRAFKLLK
jgi:nitrous oxide reductase accessory protein NosL